MYTLLYPWTAQGILWIGFYQRRLDHILGAIYSLYIIWTHSNHPHQKGLAKDLMGNCQNSEFPEALWQASLGNLDFWTAPEGRSTFWDFVLFPHRTAACLGICRNSKNIMIWTFWGQLVNKLKTLWVVIWELLYVSTFWVELALRRAADLHFVKQLVTDGVPLDTFLGKNITGKCICLKMQNVFV